jgi:hypothetical protein
MPLTIIHKHSDATTAGVADPPLNTDLASGELGINFSADDPALYIVDNANTVRKIQGTPNRKFTLQNDDVNLVGGDATTAINAALVSGAIIPSVASLLISDQVEVQDSGNPDANTHVSAGRYFYDGAVWFEASGGGGSVTISATAPLNPNQGDMWWDSEDTTALYIWYDDGNSAQWVPATPQGGGGGGTSVEIGDTAPVGVAAGTLWWDTTDADGGRLYIWYQDADGSQWVEASPQKQGSEFWGRAGTVLSPATAGDDVALGTGDISGAAATFTGDLSAAAGTFSGIVQVERDATGDTSVLGLTAKQSGAATGSLRYRTAGDFLIGEDGVLANSHFAVDAQGIVRISTAGNYPLTPSVTLRPNGQGVFRNLVSDNGKNLLVQNASGSDTFFVKGNGAISSTNGSISVIASERRLKENIVSVDSDTAWRTIKSVPYYAYNFIGSDPSSVVYGPMADEVPDEMRIATDRTMLE